MKLTTAVAALSLILALGCSKKGGGGASRVPVTIARAEQRPVPYELVGTAPAGPPRHPAGRPPQSRVGGDPRADRGTDRTAAGAGRKPGAGERGGSAGGDQPDPADPGALRRAPKPPRRHPALQRAPAAGVREPVPI